MARGPHFKLEDSHEGVVAGCDEAGRGPLAGPVVAAAVVMPRKGVPRGIDDSKKLTRELREALFDKLCQRASVGVGLASVEEIDQLNILGATKLAMLRAVEALPQLPDVVLVDGNQPPKLPCRAVPVIGGDAISLSIAAASIIAKVTRDRLMAKLAEEFPGYGWESNVGYGTRKHYQGMTAHGVTVHHRRSFGPVRTFIEGAPVQFELLVRQTLTPELADE